MMFLTSYHSRHLCPFVPLFNIRARKIEWARMGHQYKMLAAHATEYFSLGLGLAVFLSKSHICNSLTT